MKDNQIQKIAAFACRHIYGILIALGVIIGGCYYLHVGGFFRPKFASVVIWTRWPERYAGHFRMDGQEAVKFIDFTWKNTSFDDMSRVAQYCTMDIFLLNDRNSVVAGYHIHPGIDANGFTTMDKLAEWSQKGRRLDKTEDKAFHAAVKHKMHQYYRVFYK